MSRQRNGDTQSDDVLPSPVLADGHWSVPVVDVPKQGLEGDLLATHEECAQVADILGIVSCERLAFNYRLRAMSRQRYRLKGRVTAVVAQACVVSLEPVPEVIDETVDVIFDAQAIAPGGGPPAASDSRGAPGSDRRAASSDTGARGGAQRRGAGTLETSEDLSADDPLIEPIERGSLALGRIAYETLAVALDPYPRAEDSTIEGGVLSAGGGTDGETDHEEAPAGPFGVLKDLKS